ncbi:MAG: PA14 domain-containing protein, partial [bacterium]
MFSFNNYFDSDGTGQSDCSNGAYSGTCTAENIGGLDANYFKGNSTHHPFEKWDFTNTWNTSTNNYPVLRSSPSDVPATYGSVKIGLTNESDALVSGATIQYRCQNGDDVWRDLGTTDNVGSLEAVPSSEGLCGITLGGEDIAFRIAKSGYLEKTTVYGAGRFYRSDIDPEDSGTFIDGHNNTYFIVLHTLPSGNTNSYTTDYWNSSLGNTTNPEFNDSASDVSATVNTINFDWGTGPLAPGINSNYVLARFSRTAHFDAGDYTFNITSDDGERTYIDGQLIADYWTPRGQTLDTVTKTLTEGDHIITVEYYENDGGAYLAFSYGPATTDATLSAVYESADTALTPPDTVGTESEGGVSKVSAHDGSYLTTAITQDDHGYDSQVFKFTPSVGSLTNPKFNVSWIGHGAVPDGKKVYLSIWNNISNSWDELANSHCETDCTITGDATGAKYKNGNNHVFLWAKAENSYAPAVISDVTDNSALLPVQWNTDQAASSAIAYDSVSREAWDDYSNHL